MEPVLVFFAVYFLMGVNVVWVRALKHAYNYGSTTQGFYWSMFRISWTERRAHPRGATKFQKSLLGWAFGVNPTCVKCSKELSCSHCGERVLRRTGCCSGYQPASIAVGVFFGLHVVTFSILIVLWRALI